MQAVISSVLLRACLVGIGSLAHLRFGQSMKSVRFHQPSILAGLNLIQLPLPGPPGWNQTIFEAWKSAASFFRGFWMMDCGMLEASARRR